ncbi:putative amidase [Methanocella paludicola SANAE]|uniref:Amidase n=1 Tax=Methanocella paludicola (strain DSM 17711 / JCM 13418 / NBRC 101707 / SANAE) TaxID=304371 RepID=D1YX39_METPS|nr:amidase [Methanocella paludicola]BAI61011.1 putative amidase [Methanocella paludicola SANAE]
MAAFLDRIERMNPKINAVVTLDKDSALREAEEAEEALKSGALKGPLHGVPVTIKDSFETAGMRTTSGLPARSNYIPSKDATVVARLKAAGAIVMGKTNLPEFLSGCHCCNPIFGGTNNPWDVSRTPGGSSGGSAAAVASGMSALDIGSDIKGSIRVPAHFCGVYGLKPTDFMVSSTGHIPGTPRGLLRYLISIGPLARSARDLRLALSIIGGEDGRLWEVPPMPRFPPKNKEVGELKLVVSDSFPGLPVTEEIKSMVRHAGDLLSGQGATVEFAIPEKFNSQKAVESNQEVEMTAMYSRSPPWHIPRKVWQVMAQNAKNPFLRGSFAGAGSDLYRYSKALGQRDAFIRKVESFLSGRDAWMCPVASIAAPRHEELKNFMEVMMADVEVEGVKTPYDVATFGYTSIFNLTGSPVVTIPAGFTKDGLPVGLQAVGKRWRDVQLLDVAEMISGIIGTYRPPDFT